MGRRKEILQVLHDVVERGAGFEASVSGAPIHEPGMRGANVQRPAVAHARPETIEDCPGIDARTQSEVERLCERQYLDGTYHVPKQLHYLGRAALSHEDYPSV